MNYGYLAAFLGLVSVVLIFIVNHLMSKCEKFRDGWRLKTQIVDAQAVELAQLRCENEKLRRSKLVVRHYFKGPSNQCAECGMFADHDIHA